MNEYTNKLLLIARPLEVVYITFRHVQCVLVLRKIFHVTGTPFFLHQGSPYLMVSYVATCSEKQGNQSEHKDRSRERETEKVLEREEER